MKQSLFILVVNETVVRSPVFFLGAPHSGVDLVAHAVQRSPGFHITTDEPTVLRSAHALARRPSIAAERGVGSAHLLREALAEAWQLTPHTCRQCSRYGIDPRAVTCRHGQLTQRFGDASPDLLYSAQTLAAAFDDALFVQVIRDGRDVVASMLGDEGVLETLRPGGGTTEGDLPNPYLGVDTADERERYSRMSHPERCALRWRGAVRLSAQLRAYLPTERLLTLRYEEVVGAESETAERLTEFVAGTVSAPDLLGATADGIGSWRHRLTSSQQADVLRTVGTELGRLGYR